MPKSSDLLQFGGSVRQGILWRHADVTDSARALAQAHLCGPTAALVLGEALAGVALLSHELTQPEEAIALHLRVKGPIRGVTVEATRDGALRGYPRIKILNDLDGNHPTEKDVESFLPVFEVLRKRGYQKWVSMEIFTVPENPAEVLAAARSFLDTMDEKTKA